MKTAFLFAGQGAQKAGMGQDIYQNYPVAKRIYDHTPLPFDIKEVCFTDTSKLLDDTTYVQPCLLTTSVAIASVLKEKHIVPDYVCGLSLGEYSALTFAEAMPLLDAQSIVYQRGQIMRDALPANTSGMCAVLMADTAMVEDICSQVQGICVVANYNCPGQIVISGEKAALAQVTAKLQAAGVRRIIPLAVSGAFHSPLLRDASQKLMVVLDQHEIQSPVIRVVYNVTGTEMDSGKSELPMTDFTSRSIKNLLGKQIYSPVRFEQSIRYLIEEGVTHFIEIGPGTTLAGFVKKISNEVQIISVNNSEDIKLVQAKWAEWKGE